MSADITPTAVAIRFGHEAIDHPLDALALPFDQAIARLYKQATFYRAAMQAALTVAADLRRENRQKTARVVELLNENRRLRQALPRLTA